MLLIRFDVFSFYPFEICMYVCYVFQVHFTSHHSIAEKSFEMIVIYGDNSTMSNLTV